uniref:Uncharacterized protein n=1 Tax=Octopus bimaculoides TaxID=37653 RepID=A0A0L8FV10_OCTBM
MYKPAPSNAYAGSNIYALEQKLQFVDKFVYLGSIMSMTNTLGDETSFRIEKASETFRRLDRRLWSLNRMSVETKLKTNNTCVFSSLLYTCKTGLLIEDMKRLD